MKNRTPILALILLAVCSPIFARSVVLPAGAKKVLDTKFKSWRLADVNEDISKFYKERRSHEQPNLIKGDWNSDGKQDFAVQLQNREDGEKKIIVALMRTPSGFETHVLDAADCIMSEKKGKKAYNFETKRSFRFKHDAIFSYIWEKAGGSYVWTGNRFRYILTSD